MGVPVLEIDIHDLKGIKVGDWVESAYLKGYFKVCSIKHCYRDGKDVGYILLLKKAFTPKMKFSFTTEKCHVAWCEKLGDGKVCEIEQLLSENPEKKKKFDEFRRFSLACRTCIFWISIKDGLKVSKIS